MDDYDSGDDLFDGVNENDLLEGGDVFKNQPQACTRKHSLADGHLNEDNSQGNRRYDPKRQRPEQPQSPEDGPSTELARRLLNEKFGYSVFRHEQEAAIEHTLAGDNVLVVFPTGAGKSLCYQIPAIAFEELDRLSGARALGESGISIVVSPLIALMKDQVDALRRRGIPAECMDSTKTAEQQQEIRVAMRKGHLRLLYCAPERLNNEDFVESLKDVAGGVRLVAVDEAHCISEWGHSFRPDYLKVSRFVKEIKAERVVCLTATATPKVAEDICEAFDISNACVFKTSPYRSNLCLLAESVREKQDKFDKVFTFLREYPGSSLIYVTLQKQAEALAAALRQQGFVAKAFHAGMKTEEKKQIQDDFMASKVPIVVATIAFGMGIDKPDIRNVIHFDLSGTVEEYSQQIGRAGRDGKTSHCMFYICPDDFYIRENFARGDLPSRQALRGLLRDIFKQDSVQPGVDGVLKTNHCSQSNNFDIRQDPLSIIYASLELRFGLIRAITPEYTKYSFEAMPSYYPIIKADKSQEGAAIFKSASKKVKYYYIDVTEASKSSKTRRVDLVRKLNSLEAMGSIRLKASGREHRYRVLKLLPATEGEIDDLVEELYADLETREEDAMRRIHEVADLITGPECYALALGKHFGMDLPEGKPQCGHCTVCITGKRVVMPPRPPKPLDIVGIKQILEVCDVRDDPRLLARVAFGIKSPRATQLKLDKSPVFGSLADHDFKSLLREFTRACDI
ncbi:ATP-dependent DNA helicase [Pleurostoma richardsiae]|uniref:DNA 3'-5' helicase n=1 Tax=Pleurostoma richardsiae TaxID=41990 RepID=A0AA38VSQ8_9PEZI|nr:ATP-dependent DNA helicase [Pleurostoma richardsiae]